MAELEQLTENDGFFDDLLTEEEFLLMLPPYMAIALEESLEPIFHVFTDNQDIWTYDTHQAYETTQQWIEEYSTARLYVELYEDRENDDLVQEDCLLSYGYFPD